MSTVWFTSDTHFSHRAMVEKEWRPQFSSIEEMNETLVERWNSNVGKNDQIFHLGDVGMKSSKDTFHWINRCRGEKHLIFGNHDPMFPGSNRRSHHSISAWLSVFRSVQAYGRRKVGNQDVLLSHFPYQRMGDHTRENRFDQYRLPDLGLPLLCGHVHDAWTFKDRMLNVGVDAWDFTPIPLEIVERWVQQIPYPRRDEPSLLGEEVRSKTA